MTREQEIIYAAGLFDGEGCCGVYANGAKHCIIRLQLVMSNPAGPRLFAELFGGHVKLGTQGNKRRTDGTAYLPIYIYVLSSGKAARALRELLPWLREKKAQAALCLEARDIQKYRQRGQGAKYNPQDLARITAIRAEVKALKRIA